MGMYGRVLDSWTGDGTAHVVLVIEGVLREFDVDNGVNVARGSIVRITVAEDPGRASLELLTSPAAPFDPEGDVLRWRRPGATPQRLRRLRDRQAIARAIRSSLDDEGFLEVQTPLLVPATCPDLHIESFRVGADYLVTSTEYQLKRLIAGGIERLYSFTQNFRTGEVSERHNPEFTMLEWARAFAPLEEIEADVERFTAAALHAIRPGTESVMVRGHEVAFVGTPWERLTVREALRAHLGVTIDVSFSLEAIRDAVASSSVRVPPNFLESAHDAMSYLIDELTPHLGRRVPTFLREWPSFMTSSARLVPGAATLAERSELFIGGMEIADGFPSLQDPALQRALFTRENDRRAAAGRPTVALDERYLAALDQGLPPGAGMALGFDRLVMVLTGAEHIRDVLTFGWEER